MSNFRQAKRTAVPLKIALQGVSFSGKTMSAIKLAHGLANGKPVAVIDTENESAALYDHLNFLHATIKPPFKPDKYVALIREAVDMGAGAVVIDSLSHAWQYILDYKDQLDQAKGRSDWGHWAKAKPLWSTLKDAILQSPVHVIVTFREKADYAVDSADDGRGNRKNEVKKLGTKAVAEEGSEYEFTVVWKLDKDTHLARVEKDRTGLFDARVFLIDEGTGRELLQWMGEGEFTTTAAWDLLKENNPEEFKKAQEESEQFRKDAARTITNKRNIIPAVTTKLLGLAKEKGEDGIQLIIDSDRYGANDAEKIIRYVCGHLQADPVPLIREQMEGAKPGSTGQQGPVPTTARPQEPQAPKPEKVEPAGATATAEKPAAGKPVPEPEKPAPVPVSEWSKERRRFYDQVGEMGWNVDGGDNEGLRMRELVKVLLKLSTLPATLDALQPKQWSALVATMYAIRLGDSPEPPIVKGWK